MTKTKKAVSKKAAKPAKKENVKNEAAVAKAEAAAEKRHADRMEKINTLLEGDENGEGADEEAAGKIASILMLHSKGFTNKEIIEAGFNKSTVYRQTGELKKLQKAPAMEYYGHPLFEAKVQRIMKSKSFNHAKATEFLIGKVIEVDEANEG